MRGVVLAGGASRRMGQDKAALRLPDGRPMAVAVADALAEAGLDVVILRRTPGSLDPRFPTVLGDEPPDPHPLWGVAAALRLGEGPLVLVAPCDLPDLRAADVGALVAVGGPAVARAGGWLQPLLAVLPTAWADGAAALAAAGAPASRLVQGVAVVDVGDGGGRDLDTPAALAAWAASRG